MTVLTPQLSRAVNVVYDGKVVLFSVMSRGLGLKVGVNVQFVRICAGFGDITQTFPAGKCEY